MSPMDIEFWEHFNKKIYIFVYIPGLQTFCIKNHHLLFKGTMSSKDPLQYKYDLFSQIQLVFMEYGLYPSLEEKPYISFIAKM